MSQKLCHLACFETLFGCGPCTDMSLGKVTAKISVSKSGFVPGEDLIFKVQVENQSRISLRCAYAQLIQIFTFKAEGNARTKKIIIAWTPKEGTQSSFYWFPLKI